VDVQLEITLRRGYSAAFGVELRMSRADDVGDVTTLGSLAADFDPDKLPPITDGRAYGLKVGQALLADPKVQKALDDATVAAGDDALRVRLFVSPDAALLYRVAWETARDPRRPDDEEARLFAGERRVFSRYITSSDPRPLYRRPQGAMRVLVVIANPTDINSVKVGELRLAPIDEDLELSRVQEALAGSAVTNVIESSKEVVTLDKIANALTNDYDVLYLVCHGALDGSGKPVLYLQGADGTVDDVEGEAFVDRVSQLRERPRIIVLGSCKSAGAAPGEEYGAAGAFAALGPRLAEAGIPAVVAMQGNVAIEMIDDFVPAFLRYLERGSVDRAVSLARSEIVRKHRDWWAPSLLMRLRTGELFRSSGFEGGDDNFEDWDLLVAAIANRTCTPILGPALLERHVGTRFELATRLARSYSKPLPRGERDVLALLAQQLAIVKSPEAIRRQLLLLTADMVAERYSGVISGALLNALAPNAAPEMLLARLREVLDIAVQREGEEEPHRLIARLELPIYVTANPDDLLARALTRERGVTPVVEVHRWQQELAELPSIYSVEKRYVPSTERPLVYHFFGAATYQDSIVVTQDNFVDALVSASRGQSSTVPKSVNSAFINTTLLFLGFRLDDWSFRALFRYIMNLPGSNLLRKRAHVAVQVDPEESEFDDPYTARRYIARYLGDEKIRIYWGSVSDFVAELYRRQRGTPTSTADQVPVGIPAATGGTVATTS
jgi:CHAT domain-containing protein/SIR2-like protein